MSDTPYIVLARKHRPQQFRDVVGQAHIAQTLSNAIEQNRVAHALLFSGPRGVGKTSTARILTRALNCQSGPTATPCGECSSCTEILSNASVDVIEIDAASNRGIEDIRELREAVRYPPSRERFKVYIIDEVHMLTTQAFNALLKTLEEPPPRVVFILATTEPHKIPDTILSRCQRFDFRRIPLEDITAHLAKLAQTEGVEAAPEALRLVARQSEGCMRDAQSLLDQLISFSQGSIDAELASRVLGVVGRDALFRLTTALFESNVDAVLEVVDGAYKVGANLVRFASDLLSHLRDLTVASVTRNSPPLPHLTTAEQNALKEQAANTESSTLHRMFRILLETAEEMSQSAFPRLILEMALIRMTAIEPLEPIGSLLNRIEDLASRVDGGGGVLATARQVPSTPLRVASVPRPTAVPTPAAPQRSKPKDSASPSRRDHTAPSTAPSTPSPKPVRTKPVSARVATAAEPHTVSVLPQTAEPSNQHDAKPQPRQRSEPSMVSSVAASSRPKRSAPGDPRPEPPLHGADVNPAESEHGSGAAAASREHSRHPASNRQRAEPPRGDGAPKNPGPSAAETHAAAKPASESTHPQRWRRLVEAINTRNMMVGGVLKFAELLPGDGGVFDVLLPVVHADMVGEPSKQAFIFEVATDLYGPKAAVHINPPKPGAGKQPPKPTAQPSQPADLPAPDTYSVVDAEQAEYNDERRRRAKVIEDHPVTRIVRDVFQLQSEHINITPRMNAETTVEPGT